MGEENRERTDKRQRSQQHLANERTFLSWLRTCIALIGLGFIVARLGFFLEQFGLIVRSGESNTLVGVQTGHFASTVIGICVITLGIVLLIFAVRSYLYTTRAIEKEDFTPKRLNIFAATISIVVLSFAMIIYLWAFLL